jgi:hypothetical protein
VTERILTIVLPLVAVKAVGFLYARRQRPDMGAATVLNNMDVFVPALLFSALLVKGREPGDPRAFDRRRVAASAGLRPHGLAHRAFSWSADARLLPPDDVRQLGQHGHPTAIVRALSQVGRLKTRRQPLNRCPTW